MAIAPDVLGRKAPCQDAWNLWPARVDVAGIAGESGGRARECQNLEMIEGAEGLRS